MAFWGIINNDSILSLPGIGNLFVQPAKNINKKLIKIKNFIKPFSVGFSNLFVYMSGFSMKLEKYIQLVSYQGW